jgi:hypothetical protein
MGNRVGIDVSGRNGDKIAAEAISFGSAVERRGAKTVGVHMGKILDDCQAAWTAKANVTSTAEVAGKKVNAKGGKHIIAGVFATGLVATHDFASIDLSSYKYVGFWIYSDIAVAAGVLQLVLDDTAACASPVESLDIPALPAGQWRYVKLAFAGAGATRNAILSVGINAFSDPGAATVFIDDIRAGNAFLGVAEDDDALSSAYAQYDPVNIIDDGKAEVGLAATCTCQAGDALIPVGNGKFAQDSAGVLGDPGIKTVLSRMIAVNDQATGGGAVAARAI